MAELAKEAYGPEGDATKHRPLAELDGALGALPAPPRDEGQLQLIVRRLPDGSRERPTSVRLTPEQGVPGDGWNRRPPREPEAELAVMQTRIAELIANGQSLDLFGDNLFVDLDLSAANLPEATRLQVGAAVVAVTPFPHNGCSKFNARFGPDALRFVQAPATRSENRRGIYWKVVEAGDVSVGDPVRVLTRS